MHATTTQQTTQLTYPVADFNHVTPDRPEFVIRDLLVVTAQFTEPFVVVML